MAICRECGTGLEDRPMYEGLRDYASTRPRAHGGKFAKDPNHVEPEPDTRIIPRRGGVPMTTKAFAFGMEEATQYSPDELEFLKAMDQYKRDQRRPFPTWSEVFAVFQKLGYRKADLSPTSIHGH